MTDQQKRILVIEDEKPLANALKLKLGNMGYYVAIASNGQAGLDLLNKEKFDVLLLDVMMPVMDGFSVLKQIHNKPDKPIVFVLSNLSQSEDESLAYQLGAKKFFIKSNLPLEDVISEIQKALGEQAATSTAPVA